MNPESTAHGERKRESTAQAPEVKKLNDSVYELYRPAGTRSVQVVFFHGFQLEDYESAHTKTWTSGDGSVWPQTWLVEEFPEAHVLSVSYNQWVTKDRDGGTMDLFNICENLTSDLLSANRNGPRCPIILVGHSFGGLVIKELCMHMSNQMNRERDSSTKSSLENFLNDVRGMFFYATPHRGICKEALAVFAAENQSLLEYVTTLSTPAARAEFHFSPVSEKYKWRIVGLGESQPIKKTGRLAQLVGGEDLGVTPEASSRYGWRFNIAENTNHITITRPTERIQRNFTALMSLLSQIKLEGVEVKRPVHQTQGIPEYHEGLERSCRDVLEKLKKAGVLGIVGMGGIGKTTIAKAVFNKISTEFEYTCFVDNVKGIKSHKLEDRVLGHFHQDGKRQQGAIAWSTLKGKKTLLVMDDVNSEDQLKILPKPGDVGVGSRLIITSRDQSVLKFYPDYDVYEVDFLRKNEAKELFCQLAFGSQAIPEGNQRLEADVKTVLEKCQGLPLTLEMAGSYLKGHNGEAEFWKETIVRLGNVEDIKGEAKDRVWASILEMSYYALAEKEKLMFLEAGTCFFEQPLERALAVWSSEHVSCSITGWKNLLSKSMVKQVRKTKWKGGYIPGYQTAYRKIEYMGVWVHEHFRDWAKKKCEGHMVTGVDEEAGRAIDLLKTNKVKAGETQTLRLSDRNQNTKLQLSLFNEAKNLKYLELEGILHEGSVETCPTLFMLRWNYKVPSQDSLNKSDQALRWNYQVPSQDSVKKSDQVLPLNVEHMDKLAVLELSRMKISKEFPEALQNLVNLRILSLCYLKGLDHLPKDFGKLSSLKQLELEGLQISTLPDSFCKLSDLTHLSIVNCSSLERLPDLFGKPHRLEYFLIAKSPILKKLPDSFGNLKSLKDLSISGCPKLEVLPENLQGLSSLKRLQLNSCSHSSRLPNLDELKALSVVEINQQVFKLPLQPEKELKLSGPTLENLSFGVPLLSGVQNLEVISPRLGYIGSLLRLPQNFGTLSTLKRLTIKSSVLEELPESFGDLSALTDLTLECEKLQRVPAESLRNLCSLERLELRLIKRLPENFVMLSTLKGLTIKSYFLEELPESFGDLSALTDLTLDCEKLHRLPESFKDLCSLERLELTGSCLNRLPQSFGTLLTLKGLTIASSDLEELPESFGDLSALTNLTLECARLQRLPESFNHLCSLERLELTRSCLKRLPENLGTLSTLKGLTIASSDLEELPESFGDLPALTDLTLRNCLRLQRLPENIKHLCSLERLVIHGCVRLKELPNVSDLTGLRMLTINEEVFQDFSAIKQLAVTRDTLAQLSSFGLLSALEDLTLQDNRWDDDSWRLPDNFGTLATLKRLTIQCTKLEEVPESFGNLSALTDLTLGCDSLGRLPESFSNLCSLERLELTSHRLERLPEIFGTLASLKSLAINCEVLDELPESLGNLAALTDLTLRNCRKFQRLPESFKHLCSLERLVIHGCVRLRELPNVSNLTGLRMLTIDDEVFQDFLAIKQLVVTGDTLAQLSSSGLLSALEDLTLHDNRWDDDYWRLPDNFGTLATLKRLTIQCTKLEEVPESLGNLSALTDLTLRCGSLGRLPESFTNLCSLERLELTSHRLERLPESFGTLASLKSLATNCQVLEKLPESLGKLSALTDLTLRNCRRLQRLPESFKHLCCLERLVIHGCARLRELPNISDLRGLSMLTINEKVFQDFSAIKQLAVTGDTLAQLSSFGLLSALEDLTLQDNRWDDDYWRFPDNFGTLATLKRLTIRCRKLEELPESLGNLEALTDLTLRNCRRLQRLPESFKHLCSLERLVIRGCARLRELPNVSDLTGLRMLTINEEVFQDFSAIKQLAVTGDTLAQLSSLGLLSALEDLTLQDNRWDDDYWRFPDNFGTLATLKRLTIRCRKLEELPESLGNLEALTDLTLRNCRRLRRLPESFKHLCSLERLVIHGCARLRELPNVSNLTGLRMLTIDKEVFQDFSAIKQLAVTGDTLAQL